MEAADAGVSDPSLYALNELSVLFNPMTLDTDDLALVATAYAQALAGESGTQTGTGDAASGDETGAESSVDGEAIRLSLQTSLADLAAAYNEVQSAITAYEQAADAASSAAGAYSMGTGTKADWYDALSARTDSQVSIYAALRAFTSQVNALNSMTGGWVSRTQGWMTDALLPLYNTAAQ